MMSKRDKVHTGRRSASTRAAAGFTLVELMVTLAVLIILLAIGVPQMRTFLLKRQVAGDAERLVMSLQLAKTEALKRSGRVSLCPLPANLAASAAPVCVNGATTDWSNGWMVFIDARDPPDGTPYVAGSDTPVLVERGSSTGAISYSGNRRVLQFEGNGLLNSQNGTFTVGDTAQPNTPLCKELLVNRQGRIAARACPPPDPPQPPSE